MKRLGICLLNISEGRNAKVVEAVANAAVSTAREVTVDAELGIASRLARDVPGTSFFLFGTSDVPANRDLVTRRKQVGWFLGKHQMDYGSLKHDLGSTPSPRYGLTGTGGSLYVTNYNVSIATGSIALGHEIAGRIRSTTVPGGLPGVRVMAFAHEGTVEIACNVENIPTDDAKGGTCPEQTNSTGDGKGGTAKVCLDQDTYQGVRYTTPSQIAARVEELASEHSVGLVGTSVIGFTPQEARALAVHALQTGQAEFWRTRVPGAMM